MKKILISIIVIAIIIFGVYYFNKYSNTPQVKDQVPAVQTTTNTNNSVTPTTSVQTPSTKTYNISIANFAFNPNTLTINKGDTVIWTNNDSVPHQVKGDNLTDLSGPVISNGQTYSFTFNNAGTFNYHCVIHPMMKANIIVK